MIIVAMPVSVHSEMAGFLWIAGITIDYNFD